MTLSQPAAGPLNGREFADRLGVDPRRLRALIRKLRLVPSHPWHARYMLDLGDQERINAHPAVSSLIVARRWP
jgi:hypothetical protein